jgi:hypothetical protein
LLDQKSLSQKAETIVLDSPGIKIEWIGDIKKYTLYDTNEATIQKLADEHIEHYHQLQSKGKGMAKILVIIAGSLLSPKNITKGPFINRELERMAIEKPVTLNAKSIVVIKNKIIETIIKNIARSVYGNSGFFKDVEFVTSEEVAISKLNYLEI